MNHEKIISHISGWLRNYCQKAGMNGFVVGVSGGIDSALTSTLCAKTGLPVLVLNMPIRQHPDQYELASAHVSWLEENFSNVTGRTVDLTASFESLESTLPEGIQDGLTMANTRARLRMTTLYAYAGHNRCLVAGTGNKIEDFGVGFYTKYGDGGVDLSPIADLYKTEVTALAASLGVDSRIVDAPPTDGLWEDHRTDEEQMGATYPELEWAMTYVEDPDAEEIDLSSRQQEVIDIYLRLNKANRHKMEPIPVCEIPGELRK